MKLVGGLAPANLLNGRLFRPAFFLFLVCGPFVLAPFLLLSPTRVLLRAAWNKRLSGLLGLQIGQRAPRKDWQQLDIAGDISFLKLIPWPVFVGPLPGDLYQAGHVLC